MLPMGTSIPPRSLRVSHKRFPKDGVSSHIHDIPDSLGMLTRDDSYRCRCDGLAGNFIYVCLGASADDMFVQQYSDATSSWITTVRGNTKPVSGSSPPLTSTGTSGSGNCAGVSAWMNGVAVSLAQPHQRRPVLTTLYFSTRVVARSPTSEYL